MTDIGWVHPIDASDQWDGFNEPGIEHFAGSPIRSLAREITQNSLDSQDNKSSAVKVVFSIKEIAVSSIPGIKELKETLALCKAASKSESRKAEQFFNDAIKEVQKRNIQVLQIYDSNTRGIKGPAKN